jgi:hypothetical protein
MGGEAREQGPWGWINTWILSVMTTQVYLIMYVLMFQAARRLHRNQPNVQRGFKARA